MSEDRFKPIKHINTVIGVRDTMSDVDYEDWESISDLLNQLDSNSFDYLTELSELRDKNNVLTKTVDDFRNLVVLKNQELLKLHIKIGTYERLLKRINNLEERLDAIGKGLED